VEDCYFDDVFTTVELYIMVSSSVLFENNEQLSGLMRLHLVTSSMIEI